jgi:hypothetical protein
MDVPPHKRVKQSFILSSDQGQNQRCEDLAGIDGFP